MLVDTLSVGLSVPLGMMKTDYKSKRLCFKNILNIYAMYNHNSNNVKNSVLILLIIYIA